MRVDAGQSQRRFDIETLQHAIAIDIGEDDGGDARIFEAPGEIGGRRVCEVSAQPSTATLPPLASMPTAMRPGKLAQALRHQIRIAQGGGAQDHAADALVEPGLDLCQMRMPPPSCTGMLTARGSLRRPRALTGLPAKAPSRSTRCSQEKPWPRRLSAWAAGSVIEDGRLRHVAELEAHALAVFEIDGGKQDHGRQFRKLAMRARPSAWLFSGWNWLPAILSRRDQGGDGAAIVGRGDQVDGSRHGPDDRNGRNRHEDPCAERDAVEERMRT